MEIRLEMCLRTRRMSRKTSSLSSRKMCCMCRQVLTVQDDADDEPRKKRKKPRSKPKKTKATEGAEEGDVRPRNVMLNPQNDRGSPRKRGTTGICSLQPLLKL